METWVQIMRSSKYTNGIMQVRQWLLDFYLTRICQGYLLMTYDSNFL